MDLDTFITAVFCLVDDFVRDLCSRRRLRQRGPAPVLADSEVLTIEAIGEFLGLDADRALHAHFRRHFAQPLPRPAGGAPDHARAAGGDVLDGQPCGSASRLPRGLMLP
jgi:hypothetical protein